MHVAPNQTRLLTINILGQMRVYQYNAPQNVWTELQDFSKTSDAYCERIFACEPCPRELCGFDAFWATEHHVVGFHNNLGIEMPAHGGVQRLDLLPDGRLASSEFLHVKERIVSIALSTKQDKLALWHGHTIEIRALQRLADGIEKKIMLPNDTFDFKNMLAWFCEDTRLLWAMGGQSLKIINLEAGGEAVLYDTKQNIDSNINFQTHLLPDGRIFSAYNWQSVQLTSWGPATRAPNSRDAAVEA